MKFIITFGSGQLAEFSMTPNDVSLVIEADNEREARIKASKIDGVGNCFCSSFPYETFSEKFKKEYGMTEYTIEQLEELRK